MYDSAVYDKSGYLKLHIEAADTQTIKKIKLNYIGKNEHKNTRYTQQN